MLPTESHASEGLRSVTIEKGLSGFIILLDGEAGTSARLQKNQDRIGRGELEKAGIIRTCHSCSFILFSYKDSRRMRRAWRRKRDRELLREEK